METSPTRLVQSLLARMDQYKVDGSRFLMDPYYPIAAMITYLCFVFMIKQRNSRSKMPITDGSTINAIAFVHNVFLSLLSFAMLVGITQAAYERDEQRGWFSLVCGDVKNRELLNGKLGFWLHIYYLSKYWELGDTIILGLRGKPIIVLHYIHHVAMVYLSWTWSFYGWLEGSAWCVFVNSIIHFFMYGYYALSLLKIDVWWKKHLTTAQIIQLMTGFVYVNFYFYYYFNLHLAGDVRKSTEGPGCGGHLYPALLAHAFNVVLIILFFNFYIQNYIKSRKTPKPHETKKEK